MPKQMFWGNSPLEEVDCACALVAAGPKVSLQQNLGTDRMELADGINALHGGLTAKSALLDEKVNTYLEHHNSYTEKQADLIATADAPANIDIEGKVSGWDKLASDNAVKRTKHKLDIVETATKAQLDHATEMLLTVKAHNKIQQGTHTAMEGLTQGHADFEEAVAHSRHVSQKVVDKIHSTLAEHIADHERFLTRIANARRAVAR